jgi:hypothetical protein
MSRESGHGSKPTGTKQREALREKDATVEEPIARDRL